MKGIAEVYGRDEEDWLQERRQVLADSGSDDGSMKDARLGGGVSHQSFGAFGALSLLVMRFVGSVGCAG